MPPVRFLSPAWIAALDEAARANEHLRATPVDPPLVLEQVVTGDEADVAYRIVFDTDGAHVESGADAESTVRLITDATTARAIARGEGAALQAFLDGTIRIEGQVGRLLEQRDLFARLDDVFAGVRAATEW
jgi:hypothetical protein